MYATRTTNALHCNNKENHSINVDKGVKISASNSTESMNYSALTINDLTVSNSTSNCIPEYDRPGKASQKITDSMMLSSFQLDPASI